MASRFYPAEKRWQYAANQIGLHQVGIYLGRMHRIKVLSLIFYGEIIFAKNYSKDGDSRQHYRHQTGEPYFTLKFNGSLGFTN